MQWGDRDILDLSYSVKRVNGVVANNQYSSTLGRSGKGFRFTAVDGSVMKYYIISIYITSGYWVTEI